MKTAVSFFLLFLLGCNSAFGYTDVGNNTFQTDGSRNDVAAAIAAASDGYTVQIPPGSFTWTAGIVISGKGIHLQGAGAGRIIARSATVTTVGTGSKTFATQSGLGLTPGQSLTITRTGGVIAGGRPTGAQAVMVGTVASYSGTTLVMNITSITGSGTHPVWMISTDSITTIT